MKPANRAGQKDWNRRWESVAQDNSKLATLRFSSTGEAERSPFGRIEGRHDFRGLDLSPARRLAECVLNQADLSGAILSDLWIENCTFDEVLFVDADLKHIKDHGNQFRTCRFERTRFDLAGLGYKGSRYENCSFIGASFQRSVFCRAEFDDCEFIDCRLKGVDWDASSFRRCRFTGQLSDVWFRGGFALPDDVKTYGAPRKNTMEGVDFRKAEFSQATFSNDCRLDSVLPPEDGNHALILDLKRAVRRGQDYYLEHTPAALKADLLKYNGKDFLAKAPLRDATALRKKLDALPSGVLDMSACMAGMLVHSETQDHWILNRKEFAALPREYADGLWRALTARD